MARALLSLALLGNLCVMGLARGLRRHRALIQSGKMWKAKTSNEESPLLSEAFDSLLFEAQDVFIRKLSNSMSVSYKPRPTMAPVDKPTPTPVDKPMEPSVVKPTPAPVEKPTKPPVDKATPAPVDKPTKPRVDKPTPAPVDKLMMQPSNKPTSVQVDKPTHAPIDKPVKSPIGEPTNSPIGKPSPATVDKLTKPPIDEPTLALDKLTIQPVDKPAPAPVEKPLEPSVDKPTPAPVDNSTKLPIDEPTPASVDEPAKPPFDKTAPAQIEEPTLAPVDSSTLAPVEEPITSTFEPTPASVLAPTAVCAGDGESAQECGAINPDRPMLCCKGLNCNDEQNFMCIPAPLITSPIAMPTRMPNATLPFATPTTVPATPASAPVATTPAPPAPPAAVVVPTLYPAGSPILKCKLDEDEREDQILTQLSQVSDPLDLNDVATPQGQAYDWIISVDQRHLCPHDETLLQRYVLAVLYYSTAGDDWEECSSNDEICGTGATKYPGANAFLSAESECTWAGITCNMVRDVTSISLHDNKLGGSIPSELSALMTIDTLLMQENRIRGTMPPDICGNVSPLGSISRLETDCVGNEPLMECDCCTRCYRT